MRSARWLVGFAALVTACSDDGVASRTSTSIDLTAVSTSTIDVDITTSVAATTPKSEVPTTIATTDLGTTLAPATADMATIETELGSVSYTVPLGSYPDTRPTGPLPDFALGQGRWVVPDCCRVIVTLQNIEPPYPDEELVDTFVANGIEWNVYDTGPRNGTITTARGTDGPMTVLVGAQGLFTDPPGPATLPITEAVTRSVVVDLTEG